LRKKTRISSAFKNHKRFGVKFLVYKTIIKCSTSGEGKHRAVIIGNNNEVDTILIKQLSDEDAVVLEVITGNKKCYNQHVL
jgi:hypothetical protein